MAKKNKRTRQKKAANNIGAATRTSSVSGRPSLSEELKEIEEAAVGGATEEDHADVEQFVPPELDVSAEEIVKRAQKALALLESQQKRSEVSITKKEEELESSLQKLREEREELERQQVDIQSKLTEIEEQKTVFAETENKLNEQQESLILRELDADKGFAKRNREALAQLEEQAEEIRVQFSSHRSKIAEERTAWEEELQGRRSALEAELATKSNNAELAVKEWQESITAEKESIGVEHKKMRKEKRRIELEQELLVEDREALEEKVSARVAKIIESKDGEIKALTERLSAARETCDRQARDLAKREEAETRFGNKSPDEVLSEIHQLRNERDQLKESLKGSLGAEASQRLEELVRQQELWESDRLALMAELAEAKQIAARRRIAVTEMESLRDQKKAFESANKLLSEANRQVRAEVDGLIQRAEGKKSFPSCVAMDGNDQLQKQMPTVDTIEDLRRFSDIVRYRMVHDPKTNTELFYSAKDVRSLLGGLAMSRLHLLHGISGTGKTSLPLAFARAIGAGSALIEVQAGWRDRQDLIGHFNSFEKCFYETEFLQALYKASCPLFTNTPFIVVLDEMNLSHPEQYFADLLSALEQPPERQRLVLMPAPVESAPALLTEGGTKLPLPENVWFFGTANHDETTKDFADKTYDRAHVMELPRNKESFPVENHRFESAISLQALEAAFENAKDKHATEAKQAYTFLEEKLGKILGKRFRLGWGNRLQRQMESYVPVVVAAGGSVGEATDHILATKLLRKIRDRYDNRPEDLVALRDHLENEWKSFDRKSSPVRCSDILNHELQRLGHDDE